MATLPDFREPPVDEVVLGVQFEPPAGYSSVYAGHVWDLFRDEFPKVAEVPRLEPQLEIFGGHPQHGLQLNFGPAPLRGRLWFISEDENHLIQFQEDRLFLNWRKRPSAVGTGQPYPRYEQISTAFSRRLEGLNEFFLRTFGAGLKITQAEAGYVNMVPLTSFAEAGDTFEFLQVDNLKLEGFITTLVEILEDRSSRPSSRAYYELQSMIGSEAEKMARFSLTVRGKPMGDDVSSGLAFIDTARLHIISKFCDLTTPEAHKKWGRIS